MKKNIEELVKDLFEFKSQELIDLKGKNAILDELIALKPKRQHILLMPNSANEVISGYEDQIDGIEYNEIQEILNLHQGTKAIELYIKRNIVRSINKIIHKVAYFNQNKATKKDTKYAINLYKDMKDFVDKLGILFEQCNIKDIDLGSCQVILDRFKNLVIKHITELKLMVPIGYGYGAPDEEVIDILLSTKNYISNFNFSLSQCVIYIIKSAKFSTLQRYNEEKSILYDKVLEFINNNLSIEELIEKISDPKYYKKFNLKPRALPLILPNEKRFIIFERLIPEIGIEKFLKIYLPVIESNIEEYSEILCHIQNQDCEVCKEFTSKLSYHINSKNGKIELVKQSFTDITRNEKLSDANKLDLLSEIYKSNSLELKDIVMIIKNHSTNSNYRFVFKLAKSIYHAENSEERKAKFKQDVKQIINIDIDKELEEIDKSKFGNFIRSIIKFFNRCLKYLLEKMGLKLFSKDSENDDKGNSINIVKDNDEKSPGLTPSRTDLVREREL